MGKKSGVFSNDLNNAESDGRGKEGSINRCCTGIERWTLVEMVWRLMIWQPQYPPVRESISRFPWMASFREREVRSCRPGSDH
jgi:hypothetical protein